MENEKFGEVFKLHPVLKVSGLYIINCDQPTYKICYTFQIRPGLELRVFVTIKQFEGGIGGRELPPELYLSKPHSHSAVNPEENEETK